MGIIGRIWIACLQVHCFAPSAVVIAPVLVGLPDENGAGTIERRVQQTPPYGVNWGGFDTLRWRPQMGTPLE